MHTYATALALAGVTVPAHLVADAEVPVITGAQAQGDLIIYPAAPPPSARFMAVGSEGVQVVRRGEAAGNTHWLHQGFDSPGVTWARVDDGLTIGYVLVPDGQTAQLIHTDEHGANGIGPGCYAINGKREQADTIRRVAD